MNKTKKAFLGMTLTSLTAMAALAFTGCWLFGSNEEDAEGNGSGGGKNAASLTSFDIGEAVGVIDQEAKTVTVLLPSDANVKALTPTVTFTGTDLKPASGEEQDFTSPVSCTVISKSGKENAYQVTVSQVNACLAGIELLGAVTPRLDPPFDPAHFDYAVFAEGFGTSTANQITVRPLCASPQATMTINGANVETVLLPSDQSGANVMTSTAITNLPEDQKITIVVTSEPDTRTYTITRYKKDSTALVNIAAGPFMMGSPETEADRIGGNDEVQHSVTLKAFSIGMDEVTQAKYEAVTGSNPSQFRGANLPVENITWYDAVEYCNKLSVKENLTSVYTITNRTPASGYPITSATVTWPNKSVTGYRLPTEAEWEYACRAGTTTAFSYGDTVNGDYYMWYKDNSEDKTHPVGTKKPNSWGLYNMYGNVAEWCWDWYADYDGSPQSNPSGPGSGSYRVWRGGSWENPGSWIRSAARDGLAPHNSKNSIGFRVVRSN